MARMISSGLTQARPTIQFTAELNRPATIQKLGSFNILILSPRARSKLALRDTTVVEGTMNGFPFRAKLESGGDGSHWLRVNQALQDAAGADVGDTVTVEITRVGDEPECRVPVDLRKALESNPAAQTVWGRITPMARRDWVLSVISVKQAETRRRRIEITCDKLAGGMRRPCCFPGINWRRKDSAVTAEETWQALPKPKRRSSATSTR
jgi:hypothetical protein